MPTKLRLYMLKNLEGLALLDPATQEPEYFSSKFAVREARDYENRNAQAWAASTVLWHIASGPDHKKVTGKVKAWND